ncbi:hypothetical protein BDB01DRAFT_851822 [Pilobolus umbonatus]|nr:hypothetical protein BDB01DRAFT_851822 [Pilobolus umbonatus]
MQINDRLCRDYMNGKCNRKYGCKYVHDPITDLAFKIVGYPGWYGSASHPFEEFIDIKYVGRFEAFGSHESWGQGWTVTLKAMGDQQDLVYLEKTISVKDADLYKAMLTLYAIVKEPDFKAKNKFRKCRD